MAARRRAHGIDRLDRTAVRGKTSPTIERQCPAGPRVLQDERGLEYRVLRCEPSGDGSPRRLTLSVELTSDTLQERAITLGLTPREAHIAELLACRATNSEIAGELGISGHTARHHTERVLAKLGVRSRVAVRDRLLGKA